MGIPRKSVCIALAAALCGVAGLRAAAPAGTGVVVVGSATDGYPTSYVGPNGDAGFVVELFDAVARAEHIDYKRVSALGREINARFESGEFDCVQALVDTPAREEFAEFSVPLYVSPTCIVVRRTSGINRIEQLGGKSVLCVIAGSTGVDFLTARAIGAHLIAVRSVDESLQAVAQGRADGAFASRFSMLALIDRDHLGGLKALELNQAGYDYRLCFAVHRGNAALLARLNEGLITIQRNGEYAEIYDRWVGRYEPKRISLEQVVRWSVAGISLAFLALLWAYLRQRRLHRTLESQARELSSQRMLLQALYDHIPLAMTVVADEPSGPRVVSTNREAAHVSAAVSEQFVREAMKRRPEGSGVVKFEQVCADKKIFDVTVLALPMLAGEGGRYCVLAEDITSRKRADAEIAQSRKLRAVGEMVGGIAHEFNNLLTPIILQMEQLRSDRGGDAELLAETELVVRAARRSAELTQRLLTFGRKTEHNAENTHLASIVATCLSLLRLTMDRRIVLETDIPPELPPIFFNVTDLNQIVLNLVINARDTLVDKLGVQRGEWKPTIRIEARLLPAEAKVRIEGGPSSRQVCGWQCLTVSDNGMGMPSEVRERIFEPFFTTKAVGKGTGLGLATVWHLVSAASGRVEVESIPSLGTAFRVYLPMFPSSGSAAEPRRKVAKNARLFRVLLAEDDPLVAPAVIGTLERAGHTVDHLPDGAAAWQHLQSRFGDYDLLLLDINMPGMDGIELARRVRASGRYGGRIMILGGRLTSEDLGQIAEIEVDRVLTKPFSTDELLESMRGDLLPDSGNPGSNPERDS